jgi:hypothetical protein
MSLYTATTRAWLEQRFRRHSPDGVYHAHMPIYGFGTVHAEGNQLGRLARVFRLLRALDGLRFTSLLDVGGAEGWLPHLVRSLFGAEVVSTDLSVEACRRARELFGLPTAAVDSARLPFADGAFDVVVCSEVLEHVEHPVETLLELQRVAAAALLLTTEEVRYDRAAIDDYLFRRPGWPHMERNLFHPDDLAACLPGAWFAPQTDAPPPASLDPDAARRWLLAHTTAATMAPGGVGVLVRDLRRADATRARRHGDAELLDALLAAAIAPASRWPSPPPTAPLAERLRDPRDRGPLVRDGDSWVATDGTRWPIRGEVPDFVVVDAAPLPRDALAARLGRLGADPARATALLDLRDRLFLPDRWPQDHFDLRHREQRRGFWPNDQLQVRGPGPGFCWRATGPDPWVLTPCLQRPVHELELELRVHAPDVPVAAGTGQVFWKGPDDEAFEEARSVVFPVPNDGRVHTHRVVLAGHPRLPSVVQWLRLDLIDGACEVDFLSLRLR